MPILSTDIKLRASERMTDTADGGGRRTLNLIADGVAGNIFPKVSRVDSVYGRVNMRKVYGHVDTANQDTYAGAHCIITDAPDNARIHVTAFSTASDYDTRTAARDRIESYVVAGPISRMVLYGRQLLGAQALLVYQRVEEPLPEIGKVYAVSSESGGVTSAQQFVAIQDIAHEVRTFTDLLNNSLTSYPYRVLTLTIGAPLRYEFNGPETPLAVSGAGTATGRVRSTTVADASRYFGIQPLVEAGAIGDLTLRVGSVYTPIVPTTQRETALSLASVAGAATSQPTAGAIDINMFYAAQHVGTTYWPYPPDKIFLPAAPEKITVNINGTVVTVAAGGTFSAGGRAFLFDGDALIRTAGTNDYSINSFTYIPIAPVSQAAHTRAIEITLATRGTVYAPVLGPLPAPGTLMVDYRALGKWYRLRDNGAGELAGGDPAYGTGTVNYVTGGVIVTLGALPDVGSSVLLSWGSPAHYEIRTNDAGNSAQLALTLPDLPVKRGSAVVTYYVNAVATTASANSSGVITGSNNVTGTLNHVTGELLLNFAARLPDAGSVVSTAYHQLQPSAPGNEVIVSGTFVGNVASVLPGAPFEAGSVVVTAEFLTNNQPKMVRLIDDGAGSLVLKAGTSMMIFATNSLQGATDFLIAADTVVGSINYTTGAVLINGSATANGRVWGRVLGSSGGGGSGNVWAPSYDWGDAVRSSTITNAVAAYSAISTVATTDSARTHAVDLDDSALQIDLTRSTGRSIVAGSVLFALAGKNYFDRHGIVYTDLNPATGAALVAGSIDYAEGVVRLTQWGNNTTAALSVWSCLTKYGNWTAEAAFFRTAGSPLRPASLYVQVTGADGTLLTGLADQDGVITGTYMRGAVENIMGVVWVQFGQMVTAAGNELADWYDVANVVGANVWKPKAVQPDTLRYSAVVLTNLPLNADILGLDPVRLPSDGRVPIYRAADVVVVHNTLSYNAGTPSASQVLDMGRTNLAALWLEDANKLKLSTALYAANLDAGTVTMAADLSLSGYVTPITAKHRIEEMGLLSDVQINGQITLTAPLLREYPLGSFVSSALLFGDMFARVTGVFDQGTWTSVWSNTLIGAQATAQYNDVDYPITVLNSAAVSDRWRINFTSTTAFQVVSENMGVIATGSTGADCAPVNPLTGAAYFTLRAAGWGAGWAVGNQLRFNTVGAVAPVWLARTVLPGATLAGDSFDAQLRGDVD